MDENKTERTKKGIIYGLHSVLEAFEAGNEIDKVLLRRGISEEIRGRVMKVAKAAGVPVQSVPIEKLNRVCGDVPHQGIAAELAMLSYYSLEDVLIETVEAEKVPFFVMLDQISDVRNFGAIARSAECLGAHGIVIPIQGAARLNAEAIRISAGALNHIPVSRVDHLADAVNLFHAYEVEVVCCTEKGADPIFEADLTKPLCIVLGSEERGIDPKILRMADHAVSIPMKGKVSSLNVSVSGGIVMTEVLRQRGQIKKEG